MQVLKEGDAKAKAASRARSKGHDLRPWRRHPSAHFFNRASCRKCGMAAEVISQILDEVDAERMQREGVIIGRCERGTRVDFTYARGAVDIVCPR